MVEGLNILLGTKVVLKVCLSEQSRIEDLSEQSHCYQSNIMLELGFLIEVVYEFSDMSSICTG